MDKDELWLLTLDYLLRDEDGAASSARSAALNMLKPLGISNNQLILVARNETVESIVNRLYIDDIKNAIKEISGETYLVLVFLDETGDVNTQKNTQNKNQQQYLAEEKEKTVQQTIQEKQENKEPDFVNVFVNPEDIIQQKRENSQSLINNSAIQNSKEDKNLFKEGYEALFSKCTFDSFIVGPSNDFARSAALSVAEQPGGLYNPLFIYGNSGLGKTHLLLAIANYINKTAPNMSIMYAPADDFLKDYVSAVQIKDWAKFDNKYRGRDVLLIDDVQYLANKGETITQLFNIFNDMINRNRQVVLSADRAPKDIDMDERMRSRFMNGLLVDVRTPDYETRLAIIKNFYTHRQETSTFFGVIPDEVLDFIAETSTSNIREIEGAVNKIIGNMTLFRKPTISIDEAKDILHGFFPDTAIKQVSISSIQNTVENFFNISHEDLLSTKRAKTLTGPRHIAIYLSRYLTEESLESIGKNFGGRDHTTVMYSVSKIEKDVEENKSLADQIEQIRTILKS